MRFLFCFLACAAVAPAIKTLADCPVGSPSFDIFHTQATTGTEEVLRCPYDGDPDPHSFITRNYHITNSSGQSWSSYVFDVDLELVPLSTQAVFEWDAAHPHALTVAGSVVFNGTTATVNFSSPVTNPSTFTVSLRFGSYTDGEAVVNGTPGVSAVPEPGTLLVGLPLAAVWVARHRRQRAARMEKA